MRARFERYEYMIHRYEERLALECAETLLELSTRRYEIESQLDEVERHLELQSAENLRQAHAQLFILEQQTFLPSNSFDDDARSSGAAVVELDRSAKMPGAPYKWELELDSLLREVELASRAVRGSAKWKSGTSTLRKLTAIKRA